MPDSPPLNPEALLDAEQTALGGTTRMVVSAYLSALPECASLDERLALARFVAPEAFDDLGWIERFTSDRGDARFMDAGQARALIHRHVAALLGEGT